MLWSSRAPALLPPCSTHPCLPVNDCRWPAGPWLTEFTDLREQLNRSHDWDTERLRDLAYEAIGRIEASGRTHPVPAISARQLARIEAETARQRAIEEQRREEQGLAMRGGEGEGGAGAESEGAAAPAAATPDRTTEASAQAGAGDADPNQQQQQEDAQERQQGVAAEQQQEVALAGI